mmetsp:Transcript_1707/g.2720  ORF Transcript_1707/g.2720 Transcript_1707/m.2720 type:complete len:387 (+) Transcript_1707:150-1310(+)|eukprot:CAMPEP_0195284026 /NCGR_PEP_ID=MMETSP0707-20130614/2386_1 /TAXON_ID=33640 /ORGANISM="Asterionellopsis glacialis, Strain CCMP134" /LENGTH=386 /DNA_ID=CAMNT_0040343319 /DNA_START=112 /DNA_END=1272 /DNA_ORIENTATION=+
MNKRSVPLKQTTKHMSMLDLQDLSQALLDLSNHNKCHIHPASKQATLKPCLRIPKTDEEEKSSEPRPSKIVIFHKVVIREYERTLGDNPSVRRGPAISIGWRHASECIILDLEEYESTRPPRRSKIEIIVPERVRYDLLKEYGFTSRDIMAATKEINITRKKRAQTAHSTEKTERAHFVLEKAGRKLKKAFGNKTKKQEAKLWNDAVHSMMQKAHSTNDLQALSEAGLEKENKEQECKEDDGTHSEEFTTRTIPDFGSDASDHEENDNDGSSSSLSLDATDEDDEANVVVSEKFNHFGSKRICSALDLASMDENDKKNSAGSLTSLLGSVPESDTDGDNGVDEPQQQPLQQQGHVMMKSSSMGEGLLPDMEATSEEDDEWASGEFF